MVPHKTFPKDCGLCHVAKRWDVIREDFSFDHEKETGVRLEGAHRNAYCIRCHNDRGPIQKYIARGCAGCHGDIHQGSLGNNCSRCHDQISWNSSAQEQITHHASTQFPLTGIHRSIACEKCHASASHGEFRSAQPECFNCHQDKFRAAPNHEAMGFSHDCALCHTTMSWSGARFDHSQLTGGGAGACYNCHINDFQRGPNHVSSNFSHSCETCHTTQRWSAAAFDHNQLASGGAGACYTCHMNDFQRGPNHVALNFSHSCETCHNTHRWTGATFDHNQLSNGGIGSCYSCHTNDFQRGPNHANLNFSHSCEGCHVTTSWRPANFNHSYIPSGGNGACYSCHQADYQRAPNHLSMSFPQSCESCHSTVRWTGALLNHQFPLTGHHNVSCQTCHNTASTSVFTCLVCHEHAQPSMDSHHRNVSGYSYDSTSCYSCHPDGRH